MSEISSLGAPFEERIWAVFGRYVRSIRGSLPERVQESFMTRAYESVFDMFEHDAFGFIEAIKLPANQTGNLVFRFRIGHGIRRRIADAALNCLADIPHGLPFESMAEHSETMPSNLQSRVKPPAANIQPIPG
jgi:hypothetical protein